MRASKTTVLQEKVDSLQALTDSLDRASYLRNPLLNSTLWTQTAAEYEGTARQAYVLAEVMMKRALVDSTWTASIEQAEDGSGSYREKPPAVVLDVDETVLDNSPYQARLILDDEAYGSEKLEVLGSGGSGERGAGGTHIHPDCRPKRRAGPLSDEPGR